MTTRSGPPEATAAKLSVAYVRRSTDRQEQSLGDQRKVIPTTGPDVALTVNVAVPRSSPTSTVTV